MTETGQYKGRFSRKSWSMLIAIISGLLFPFVSILIIILQSNVQVTFKNILRIHLDHPELLMLYILPLVSAYIVHILYSRQQKTQSYFQNIISKKNETINQNAQFANEIGKGN